MKGQENSVEQGMNRVENVLLNVQIQVCVRNHRQLRKNWLVLNIFLNEEELEEEEDDGRDL
jgi:hypothetical protein